MADLVADTRLAIIVGFARRAMRSLRPDVRQGDEMDIGRYFKVREQRERLPLSHFSQVKTIPGGRREDSVYIDGVVLRKNVSHKKMRCRIPNAKVLLLRRGLEFERQDARMSSLEVLVEQVGHSLHTKERVSLLGAGKSIHGHISRQSGADATRYCCC